MAIAQRLMNRDELKNLVRVLYQQLEAADTAALYTADAEQSDDPELVAFFQRVLEQSRTLGERAQSLLQARLAGGAEQRASADTRADEASRESFPASDAPAY